jgi:hypothetical protein
LRFMHFTSDYPLVSYDEEGKSKLRELAYTKKDGLVQVGEWFSIMNMLTSKVTNGKTLEASDEELCSVLLLHFVGIVHILVIIFLMV